MEAVTDDDDDGGGPPPPRHIMPWLATIIPGRLYVGPFLNNAQDAHHVYNDLGVTHIVNLSNGDKPLWYKCFFGDRGPSVLRFPLPSGADALSTLKEGKQVAYFRQLAQRVVDSFPSGEGTILYIHNRSGHEEEATLALIVAGILEKRATFDVEQDVIDLSLKTRLLDNAEQQALVRGALSGATTGGGARDPKQGVLDGFFKKRQKI
jgi:hypothetical protein